MPDCTVISYPYQTSPLEWFDRFYAEDGAVLLDSGRPLAERGRFDILSAWPDESRAIAPNESGEAFLQRARLCWQQLTAAQLPANCSSPFAGGLLGYFSYDFGRRLEALPTQAKDDLKLPHAMLGLYSWALVTDHQTQQSWLIFHPACSPEKRQKVQHQLEQTPHSAPSFALTQPFSRDWSQAHYAQQLQRVLDYIRAGDCYQINLTQRFQARFSGSPWLAYQRARRACPTPYSGFIRTKQGAIASLSPERFLQASQGVVNTRPIKGTRPRGQTPAKDAQLADELKASPKDRAENLMIVDLLRNDLGRACAIGSVRVDDLFSIESYPNVHHLVSGISGTLAEGEDALSLLSKSFPGGSITGAPKIRAMQIIDELESTRRSIYCGSLMYLDARGFFDSSITIRTLLFEDDKVFCWGGGGIVADSQAESEYAESITKVSVLLDALAHQ